MPTRSLPSRRLWLLLGLSLALHLAVLGSWHTAPLQLAVSSQPLSLAVTLQAIEVTTRPRRAQTAVANTAPAGPEEEHAPGPDIRPAEAQQPARKAAAMNRSLQSPRPRTAQASVAPALNRARIITRLRRDLEQYFTYPPLARRRNLQGTVLLAFDVTNEGRIERIGIRKSSGYAILDLAAREAMRRLARLDWLAGKLERDRMNIELPVIYKLTES